MDFPPVTLPACLTPNQALDQYEREIKRIQKNIRSVEAERVSKRTAALRMLALDLAYDLYRAADNLVVQGYGDVKIEKLILDGCFD